MASQTGVARVRTDAPVTTEEPRSPNSNERRKEEIARRAYEMYEESGKRDGDDLLHWLAAEEEISAKFPEKRK